MAVNQFNLAKFGIRLLFAIVLVFATYNPVDPWSYYHWALKPLFLDIENFSIVKGIATVALIIGWGVFLSATYKSLGALGTVLTSVLFGLTLWWMIDIGWISLDKPTTMHWLILVVLCCVLAIGISWSHIRRRLTGQVDVEDAES